MPDLTRITINLTPKAAAALERLVAEGESNRTDAINRALRVSGVLHQAANDGALYITRPDGTTERLYLL